MRLFDRWLTAAICCGACALAGCARKGTVAPVPPTAPVVAMPITHKGKANFAYTGNQGRTLSGYSVNTFSGALTALKGFPLAIGVNPTAVAVDPQNRFLFVGDIAIDKLYVFAINRSTGALDGIGTYPTVHEPVAVVVDPSGTHVYVASQGSNLVYGFSLNESGALKTIAGSPFATSGTKGFGNDVVINAAGTFLYVQDISSIYTFSVNAGSGALTLVQTIAGPLQGGTIALDPRGTYLYAVGAGANSIQAYRINSPTGLLTPASSSPMVTGNGAYAISISPSGRFAYTIENTSDLVSYRVNDGVFTPIASVYSHIYGERIGIDPSGKYVYVPQACSNCSGDVYDVVNEFSIGKRGALKKIPSSPVAAGKTPWDIAITTRNPPTRQWWRRAWSAFCRWNRQHRP